MDHKNSALDVFTEAVIDLQKIHLENLPKIKPFNDRIFNLIKCLECFVDNKNYEFCEIQSHTFDSLDNLVTLVKNECFYNNIGDHQFEEARKFFKISLAYYKNETDLEFKTGDGLEKLIIAIF
jgi:hypothetical protein